MHALSAAEERTGEVAAAGIFLSYSRADAQPARRIQEYLKAAGLATFLDRDQLPAGQPWLPALEKALARCAGVAVIVGPSGLGTWQQREVQVALDRQAQAERAGRFFPVIPILLPKVEDPPGGFLRLQTWVDLRSDLADPGQLHLLLTGLRGEAPAEARTLQGSLCPYRGLLPFREEDAGLFFGREQAIDTLLQKLQSHDLVTLVGRSGSGKSSVVLAGLVPALRRRADHRTWSILALRPGAEPLHALVRLFDPPPADLPPFEADQRVEQQVAILREGRHALGRRVRGLLAAAEEKGTDRLLLYVDQWEELYTQASRNPATDPDSAQRDVTQFIDLVLEATRTSPCSAVLSVRADFYAELLQHETLAAAVPPGQVNLGPLERGGLADAIRKPAEAVGLTVDPPLVETLIDEVYHDVGKLPLLEYALKETWRRRDGQRLTLNAYGLAGGIDGAVAQRANQIFASLSPAQQAAARSLFVTLVTPGEGREDTRARAVYPQQDEAIAAVIDKFSAADARLLVTGDDAPSGQRLIEISHEAMIREWDLLKGWIQTNREALRRLGHIRARLRQWEEQGRDTSLLLPSGLPLEEGRKLLADHGDVLIDEVKPYVLASLAADEERRKQAEAVAEAERQRELAAAQRLASEQRKRARIATGFSVVALLLTGSVVWQWLRADSASSRAERYADQAIENTAELVERAVKLSDSFGVPRLATGELLTQAADDFEQLMQEGASSLQLRARRAELLMVLADHYNIIGDPDRQWEAVQEARVIAEGLVADHPSDVEGRRQLAISHDLTGDILVKRRQLNEALREYRAARSIREGLSRERPADLRAQRELAISDNKIGDILFRQGHLEEALSTYRSALQVAESLARAQPVNIDFQRDVLVNSHRMGDVLARKGDLRGARDVYESSLRLARQLGDHNPSNIQLQRDLSASHEKVGNALEDEGDIEAALGSYRASLAITERLVADDPKKLPLQRDLMLGHENVGRVLLERGDQQAALRHYRASLAVIEQLAASDPASIDLERDLMRTHDRIGELLYRQGELAAAIAAYRASLSVAERLSAAEPKNAEWKYLSYRQSGLIREHEGKAEEAGKLYCLAKDIAEEALALSSGATSQLQWKKRTEWLEDHLAVVQGRGAASCRTAYYDRTRAAARKSLKVSTRRNSESVDNQEGLAL